MNQNSCVNCRRDIPLFDYQNQINNEIIPLCSDCEVSQRQKLSVIMDILECLHCKNPITRKRIMDRMISGRLPVCEDCALELDEKLLKWLPLFEKMKF